MHVRSIITMKKLEKTYQFIWTHLKVIGIDGVRKALILWFGLKSPHTPLWAKAIATGALAYLVMPLDLIPDTIPGGFVDDLGVLAGAVLQITAYLDPECVQQADRQLAKWFGVNPSAHSTN